MATAVFLTTKPDEKHVYQASLQKAHLLATAPSPRIIIFGGSNIAFGIDSKLIEEELDYHVINDGLHVALGVAPLKEIERYLRPGDIVIISLEYYNFDSETSFYGQPQYLADWIELAPERIWYLQEPIRQMPSIYTIMLQRKINRVLQYYTYGGSLDVNRGIYTGGAFDEHGDFITFPDRVNQKFEIDSSAYPITIMDEAYVFLEAFNQSARSKGATVFYEAQAHRQSNCDSTGLRQIKRFFSRIRSKTTIPVLTDIDHVCMADKYFYDTAYHLNEQGREIRTQRLIDHLKTALGME
jgi:hypothetical protein